jgi:Cysteine-rich secretory protein family
MASHTCHMQRRNVAITFLIALLGVVGMSLGARPAGAAPVVPSSAADQFVALINQTRASHGLGALTRDSGLDNVARQWSSTMASTGNFSHRTNLGPAIAAVEPNWRGAAENIGMGDSDSANIAVLHANFVASPGHYANIVGDYNRVGVGVVVTGKTQYVTVNFLLGPAIAPAVPVEPTLPAPALKAASGLTAINPVRVVDTRPTGAIAGGSTFSFKPSDRVGDAAGAQAVAINITIVGASGAGYVTVWPCDATKPDTSSLNHEAGETKANSTTVAVAGDGRVCVFTQAGGNFLVDMSGYYKPNSGLRYTPQTPARLIDTRSNGGQVQQARFTVPGGAGAAALNITVTAPTAGGYITVWPCDQSQPTSSNLNFRGGETAANLVLTRVAGNGAVCMFSSVPAHMIADLAGTAQGSGNLLVAAEPRRAVDTRSGIGGRVGMLASDVNRPQVVNLKQLGRVAGDATGVVLTVTATGSTDPGWLAVYPCDQGVPKTSNVNFADGQTVANAVISKLDGSGQVCIASMTAVHVIADVVGWLA